MVWPAVLAGGAAILGASMANDTNRDIAQSTNVSSAQQAGFNRQFQEHMFNRQAHRSNNAYLLASQDLRRAGINPILAGKFASASTPGGSFGSGYTPTSARVDNVVTPGVNSALSYQRTQSDVALQNANQVLVETKDKLQSSLVPGAEAISVVTSEIAKLANAASELLSVDKDGYKEALSEIKDHIDDWMTKAAENGKTGFNAILDVLDKSNELKDDAILWLKRQYLDTKDSVREFFD